MAKPNSYVSKGRNKGRMCPRCKGTGKRALLLSFRGFIPKLEDTGDRCDYCGGKGRINQ